MKRFVNKRVIPVALTALLLLSVMFMNGGASVVAATQDTTVQDKTQQVIDLIMKDLPVPRNTEGQVKRLKVAMRDGVNLEVQVFLPEGTGPWPTILIRNPYGSFKFFNEAILRSFSRFGYAGVLVDQRGTGNSEGKWEPYVNEKNDGIDVLNWLVKQDWMNGNIGLYGHSYLAFSEWIIADQLPPQVKTMYLSAFGTDRYEQMYQDGMFKQDIMTYWAAANSGIKTTEKSADLYQKALKASPAIDMDLQVFGTKLPWYRDWLTNVSSKSDFWQNGLWADLKEIPEKINIPIFMKVGWYDHNLNGMVEAYENLPEKIKKESRFLIGPWVHSQGTSGDIEYPNSNIAGTDGTKIALEWFDHQLQGRTYDKAKAVETYVIRDGTWKVWDDVPVKSSINLRMFLNQAENLDYKGGSLGTKPDNQVSSQKYVYDPGDPVPTYGGEVLLSGAIPNGNKLQSKPGAREDILTYISEPFEEDTEIAGKIGVNLYVSTDAEDTSFTAKVMEVFPDGSAYNIRDSITSLAYRNGRTSPVYVRPGRTSYVKMNMWPVTWTIKKGSKLRIDISSSNFPAYNVHPNVKGLWAEQSIFKIANQTVFMGGKYKSYIELPIAKK